MKFFISYSGRKGGLQASLLGMSRDLMEYLEGNTNSIVLINGPISVIGRGPGKREIKVRYYRTRPKAKVEINDSEEKRIARDLKGIYERHGFSRTG